MPTYMLDITVTDRYRPDMRPQLESLAQTPREGWEFREGWKSGSVSYWRFTTYQEHASLAAVCASIATVALEEGTEQMPVTASMAIRDVSFALEEVLPYRYSKARPRGRGGPVAAAT